MSTAVTVLASGGLDSAACIAYYVRRGDAVRALWVDYGQVAARAERAAAARLARHYHVPLARVRLAGVAWGLHGDPPEFPARNLTLAAIGLNSHLGEGLVALGVHAGSPFPDCSPAFVEAVDGLARLATQGRVRVDCPFVDWGKDKVYGWALNAAVPTALTYSCTAGQQPPCGVCAKCRERNDCLI